MTDTKNTFKIETYPVVGMTCAGCAAGVEKKIKALEGVKAASVNFASENMQVEFDPKSVTPNQLKKAVQSIGYDILVPYNKPVQHILTGNFPVLKMTCAGCAASVEKKIASEAGVTSASVNFSNENLQVQFDPQITSPEKLQMALQQLGYDMLLPERSQQTKEELISETFMINGMTCASCAASVENKIKTLEGVKDASVNFANSSALVSYFPNIVVPGEIKEAVSSIGYDMLLPQKENQQDLLDEIHQKRYNTLKKKTIWSLIFAVPLIAIGMIFMNMPYANLIMWLLSTPVVLWLGRDFFINAWKQAKYRTANMDTLVALSTGTAYVFSVFNMVYPQFWENKGLEAHVYFEAAAVIIAFILLGRLLEERAKGNTSSALKKLMGLQPKTVNIMRDGRQVEIAIDSIKAGDIVVVKPGEKIAVDGSVVSGESFVDESMLSGEPMAVRKSKNEKVYAGTINQKGSFNFRADKIGKETMLAQIIKMVQDAQGSKAPVQKLVDKIAAVFVPVVIGIAVLTFIVWMVVGGENSLTHALLSFVTVLVIACPCALGLATPTAIMVGVGKGAEQGILIKDAESLELSKKVTTVVLDKTGTITEGKPRVSNEYWINPDAKSILAGLENVSEHPLADAIMNHLRNENIVKIENFISLTGRGVKGDYEGSTYLAGNRALLEENEIDIADDHLLMAEKWSNEGKTAIWFAGKEKVMGLLAVSDKIKQTSLDAIQQLHELGIELHMLTGDNRSTSEYIAQQAGIDHFEAEVLPHEKAEFVKELQQEGKIVAMVGDGINDSAALAQSDVSIAMGQGSDIAMDVAKMTIISSDLTKIPKAIRLSKQTVKTIRQNLFWAFIYNVIGIPIAAGILYPVNGFLLNPMIAGAAMALSSVSVVSNSLRLKWKK